MIRASDILRAHGVCAAAEPQPHSEIVDAFRQLTARLGDTTKKLTRNGYRIDVTYHDESDMIRIHASPVSLPSQVFCLDVYEVTEHGEPVLEIETSLLGHAGKLSVLREPSTRGDLLLKLIQILFDRIETERPGRAHAAAEPGRSSLELLAGADWLRFGDQFRGWKHYDSQYFRLSVNAQGDLAVFALGRGNHRYIAQLTQVPAALAPQMIRTVGKLDAALRKLNTSLRFNTAGVTGVATTLVRKVFPKAVVRLTENLDGDPELEVHDE